MVPSGKEALTISMTLGCVQLFRFQVAIFLLWHGISGVNSDDSYCSSSGPMVSVRLPIRAGQLCHDGSPKR